VKNIRLPDTPHKFDPTYLSKLTRAIELAFTQVSVPDPGTITSAMLSPPTTGHHVVLTDGATVTIDASLGNYFTLLAGGSRTIAVPTNAPAVDTLTQQIVVTIFNNTAGAITTTWNTGAGGFSLAGAWVDPATNKRRTITFQWWQGSGFWIETSRTAADQA